MMVAGVGLATKAKRGLEFYNTPVGATLALIALEGHRIPLRIWEPACGEGAMAGPLKEAGFIVYSTDIVDRGYGDGAMDFLAAAESHGSNAVVTNPPFTRARGFVDQAFSFPSVSYCALLLRLAFLESERRKAWFQANPPARILVSSFRLPMMHRENWDGPKSTSAVAYAWFVWLRGYDGDPAVRWFDWRDSAPTQGLGETADG
jgi:hypothetical protein